MLNEINNLIIPYKKHTLRECHEIIMTLANLHYPDERLREPLHNEWKTKDGRIILIKDLQDQHLINVINLLIRTAPVQVEKHNQYVLDELDAPYPSFNGEMAQYYAEQHLNSLICLTVNEYLESIPQWSHLIKEAEKRNIQHLIKWVIIQKSS